MITDEILSAARKAAWPWADPFDCHCGMWGTTINFDEAVPAIIAAVAPMIRAAALEEAAAQCDFMAEETQKAANNLRDILGDGAAMAALLSQVEAAKNRATAIRALKETSNDPR